MEFLLKKLFHNYFKQVKTQSSEVIDYKLRIEKKTLKIENWELRIEGGIENWKGRFENWELKGMKIN